MQINKTHVEYAFKEFLNSMGLFEAQTRMHVGGYWLDYDASLGGYLIMQIGNQFETNHWTPFGTQRLNKKEMFKALQFAANAIEFKKQKERENI